MTSLSVNLNKIALLRNARGRDYPNVAEFAQKLIALGVHGITVHPRQDERHTTQKDAHELGELLRENQQVEFNIEGYPSEDFLRLVEAIKPTQCTLVPDAPDQLTSDHGWDVLREGDFLRDLCSRLSESAIRTSIFLDPDVDLVEQAKKTGTDRIELYTEAYATSFGSATNNQVLSQYRDVAGAAQKVGLGVNAGHDLDLENLALFLTIDGVLEVSITIPRYLQGRSKIAKFGVRLKCQSIRRGDCLRPVSR
jgi:pyridoxine 5-phosphate synthase